jgi:flavin-dependent dehydrogenase
MNDQSAYYDVAIAGGGLAGLATAIQFARDGYRVILFEKELYPFHKVCGEYMSFESLDFLRFLGLPIDEWELPQMNTLELSSPSGNVLKTSLPLGGFGVSRYKIDSALMQIAQQYGAVIRDGTKVQDIQFENDAFTVVTDKEVVRAKLCCGAFGKRSNIDVKWKRGFIRQKPGALNNFIGVKYHARLDHPRNTIALHNFSGGYCGIAAIEEGKVNICYLTTAQNLRSNGNDLQKMEEEVLFKNPFLKKAFSGAAFLFERPTTISQISFEKKEQVCDHVLLLGDAAGMITPLCGNGMSMALHSSRIAVKYMMQYLEGMIARSAMESKYARDWQKTFSLRLKAGRIIQGLFGSSRLTDNVVRLLRPFPSITRSIIRKTHG